MKASTFLLSLWSALLPIPTAEACLCQLRESMGNTGAEIAQSLRNYAAFVFVGRVLNETSYTPVNDPGEFPREFQSVTFSLDETLVESTGSLPSYVVIGDDGTMTVETHTETTCCFCGWALSSDDVGAEYLINGRDGSLMTCSINCRTDTEYCAEIVSALRAAESGASTEGAEEMVGDEGVDEELEGSNVSSAACTFMQWLLVLPWPSLLF